MRPIRLTVVVYVMFCETYKLVGNNQKQKNETTNTFTWTMFFHGMSWATN
jgi:hypothetical protein